MMERQMGILLEKLKCLDWYFNWEQKLEVRDFILVGSQEEMASLVVAQLRFPEWGKHQEKNMGLLISKLRVHNWDKYLVQKVKLRYDLLLSGYLEKKMINLSDYNWESYLVYIVDMR